MDTDFLLIRRMKKGDEAAVDLFIRKYYEDILKYCSFRCYDREDAEDLTQETFVRFLERLTDYRYEGKTKNYLYTVAGNLCKDFRKKKKEMPAEEKVFDERAGTKGNPAEELIEKLAVEWALEQLPDELYEVVILYYFHELKLREISDVLQIGLPLVKYRVKQAKRHLERLLGEEEFYGSGRKAHGL